MERVIIAAVAENGVIGKNGDIPWHYPDDFKHFKETTYGHPVIMGRATYESLPDDYRPLPSRTNIVLSRSDMDGSGIVNAHSIDGALDAAANKDTDTAYIAGGASIYEQFLEQGLVDKMVLTEIPEEPDGDTYFPDWDEDLWNEVKHEESGDLTFVTYVYDGD
jgi:dihydrofolate reductase